MCRVMNGEAEKPVEFPKYSIIIPAYNESARIPATLEAVVSCIRERGWPAEVVVVNDGSRLLWKALSRATVWATSLMARSMI